MGKRNKQVSATDRLIILPGEDAEDYRYYVKSGRRAEREGL